MEDLKTSNQSLDLLLAVNPSSAFSNAPLKGKFDINPPKNVYSYCLRTRLCTVSIIVYNDVTDTKKSFLKRANRIFFGEVTFKPGRHFLASQCKLKNSRERGGQK